MSDKQPSRHDVLLNELIAAQNQKMTGPALEKSIDCAIHFQRLAVLKDIQCSNLIDAFHALAISLDEDGDKVASQRIWDTIHVVMLNDPQTI